jgi:adenylosuccinate synthase
MAVDVIIGLQRGDEGKGRFVDLVADNYQIIARGNGGANAGHTIVPEGKAPIALHQIPSGIVYADKLNIIGGGVYLDPKKLLAEIEQLKSVNINVSPENLKISTNAHLVFPHHIVLDQMREAGESAQGSTKSGIAFVASDKYLRAGLRVESIQDQAGLISHAYEGLKALNNFLLKTDSELQDQANEWCQALTLLSPYIEDTVQLITGRITSGADVLVEGAQAFGLDIDHGMYPFVTSSSTTVTGLLGGLGIAPKYLRKVTGVAKLIKSHVGGGPFVTEILDQALSQSIRGEAGAVDSEYGATTKRPRRIGYPDLPELRSAISVNGVDELVLSKFDHITRFGPTFKVATEYMLDGEGYLMAPSSALALENCTPVYQEFDSWQVTPETQTAQSLPIQAKEFITFLEDELEVKVGRIGIGPERNQVINLT